MRGANLEDVAAQQGIEDRRLAAADHAERGDLDSCLVELLRQLAELADLVGKSSFFLGGELQAGEGCLQAVAGALDGVAVGLGFALAGGKTIELIEHGLDAFAHVARRLAGPHHVSEISRGVIEGVDFEPGIVRTGDEGVARSQAGAQNPKFAIALGFKPVEASANVADRLPPGVDGAAHVRRNRVVGALQLGWFANVMIRHGHAQGRDAAQVKDAAQSIVAEGVGIPLRQHDHGAAATGGKPARVHEVVFRVERFHWRSEAQEQPRFVCEPQFVFRFGLAASGVQAYRQPLKVKISRLFVAIKLIAVSYELLVQIKKVTLSVFRGGGCFAVDSRPAPAPLQTPFEWARHAIGIARGQPVFPAVHPFLVAFQHGERHSSR